MDVWLYLSNVAIGVVVWAVTKFGIPWTNREFHTDIPDNSSANAELVALIQGIWQKELERHLKLHHPTLRITPPPPSPTYTFNSLTNTPSAPAATTSPDPGVSNA